jgi:hypothetical protein
MESYDEPVENAWLRSHAQCEGRERQLQGHRCGCALVWEHRGRANRPGAWEAYRKGPQGLVGWEEVQQIAILCWECYQQVEGARSPAQGWERDRAATLDSRRGRA